MIGAGASRAYGVPASDGVRMAASKLGQNSHIYQLIAACGTEATSLNDVLSDIRQHQTTSLDAYIESRRPERH